MAILLFFEGREVDFGLLLVFVRDWGEGEPAFEGIKIAR